MSTKNKPAAAAPVVTAKAVISGEELSARAHDLPLQIVKVLKDIGDKTKRLQGSIQDLAVAITESMEALEVNAWYSYKQGDPSEEAEPVHALKAKIIAYYETDLGHSNGSSVWNQAREYARKDAEADDTDEGEGETRGKKAAKNPIMLHLFGSGSYKLGDNKGAAVKLYRRVAGEIEAKQQNPALREFQKALGDAMMLLAFDVTKLEGKESKDSKKTK
jgi:hypothetical protein